MFTTAVLQIYYCSTRSSRSTSSYYTRDHARDVLSERTRRARVRARLGCGRGKGSRRKTPTGCRTSSARPISRARRMSHARLVPIDAFSDQEKCGGLPVSIARLPSLAREGDDRHRRRHRRSCRRHAHGARRRRCRPQLLGGRPHGAQGTRRSIVAFGFCRRPPRRVLLSRSLSPTLPDTSLTSRCPVNVHLHRIPSLASLRCSSRTRTPIR